MRRDVVRNGRVDTCSCALVQVETNESATVRAEAAITSRSQVKMRLRVDCACICVEGRKGTSMHHMGHEGTSIGCAMMCCCALVQVEQQQAAGGKHEADRNPKQGQRHGRRPQERQRERRRPPLDLELGDLLAEEWENSKRDIGTYSTHFRILNITNRFTLLCFAVNNRVI